MIWNFGEFQTLVVILKAYISASWIFGNLVEFLSLYTSPCRIGS